ncbi:MAG: glycosyltransferase family 4 protein [Duganella sp.]
MHIAYITSIYARASDTFIRNEVLALRQRGHTVDTFSIRKAEAEQEVDDEVAREQASTDYILRQSPLTLLSALLKETLRAPGRMLATARLAWTTRALGMRGTLLQGVYLVEAAYLAGRLRARGVQVLHNHVAENSANVAMLASCLSGIPFSMTVHGPGIFYDPRKWALAEKIRRSAFTVCITHFCKSQCMVFVPPADIAKLHVVRCSVGAPFRNVAPLPIPDVPRFVCIGRLCPEKGMLVLIEAVAAHVAAGGRCEVNIIGDGPSRPLMEQMIEVHGLQQSVRLLGWQGSTVVRGEIERSRALILPSFAEGLPIVVLETLALGRPVISSRINGIPELVVTGRNGWLTTPAAVEELVAVLAQASTATPEQLQEMGRIGAQDVHRLHGLETEIDKLEALLAGAAGTGTVTPGRIA